MSASTSSTFLPDCAITAARLLVTKDLPTPGLGPVIIRMLFLASIMAKCRLVRRLRMASVARSAGSLIDSR